MQANKDTKIFACLVRLRLCVEPAQDVITGREKRGWRDAPVAEQLSEPGA